MLLLYVKKKTNQCVFTFSIPFKFPGILLELPFALIADPENKLVWLTTEIMPAHHERKHVKSGKMFLKYLDEELDSYLINFSMKRFHPFFDEVKLKIGTLLETGQILWSISGQNFKSEHENIDADIPPLVLNMNDLEIGFVICLISLLISIIAFFCELFLQKFIFTFMTSFFFKSLHHI